MFNAARVMFPFDGSCDGSRNADLTIAFNAGESLKAHSRHLCDASGVLKTAIEECKHEGTLNVEDDSREAWVLLLNLVHPGRRLCVPDFGDELDFARLEAYANLGQKYAVQCVLDYLDFGLCQHVANVALHIPEPIKSDYLRRLPSAQTPCFTWWSRFAARFRLEATQKAHAAFVKKVLAGMKTSGHAGSSAGREVGTLMSEHVRSLSAEEDSAFAAMVAEKALSLLQL